MGLILIKMSLQEKSYSNLKKRFPTMCETLDALRNPPLHLLEEEIVIKKVFIPLVYLFHTFCYNFFFLSSYKWRYLQTHSNFTMSKIY